MTRPADKPNSKAQTTRVMCAISASALPIPGAVIVSAFGDPGADGLQARLTCPVVDIGAGGICRWRGLCGGDHDPALAPMIDSLMQAKGSAGRYLGCFCRRATRWR